MIDEERLDVGGLIEIAVRADDRAQPIERRGRDAHRALTAPATSRGLRRERVEMCWPSTHSAGSRPCCSRSMHAKRWSLSRRRRSARRRRSDARCPLCVSIVTLNTERERHRCGRRAANFWQNSCGHSCCASVESDRVAALHEDRLRRAQQLRLAQIVEQREQPPQGDAGQGGKDDECAATSTALKNVDELKPDVAQPGVGLRARL